MLLLKFQLGHEGLLVPRLFVEKRVNMAGSVGFEPCHQWRYLPSLSPFFTRALSVTFIRERVRVNDILYKAKNKHMVSAEYFPIYLLVLVLALSVIWYQFIYVKPVQEVWHRLAFTMQTQQQTFWCWAAVAASVSAFFNPSTTWTQCGIVNAELGRTDCCTNGSSANCNVPWFLDDALTRTGNFRSMSNGAGTMTDVSQDIDIGRPLCVRIQWSGDGGGHFVAIDGYHQGLDMVAVDDPWSGASDVSLATFQTAYRGSGSWTHSYRVQP